MSSESRVRLHAIILGRVQGVGFRWATTDRADELGVGGFARNLDDGSVEVEAEGSPDQVAELAQWLERGPRWAHVESVDSHEIPATGEHTFRIA